MNEIEEAFNRTFANWDIQLPAEAAASRSSGRLVKAGWTIEYLFGHEGGQRAPRLLCSPPHDQ